VLLGLNRAALYYHSVKAGAAALELMALLDRQYLRTPFYGSRRMTVWLQTQGHMVNRKRVQHLMQRMGLAAIYQRPRTSRPAGARTSDLPLSFARVGDHTSEPGVGRRYNVHPDGAWFSLPGRGV